MVPPIALKGAYSRPSWLLVASSRCLSHFLFWKAANPREGFWDGHGRLCFRWLSMLAGASLQHGSQIWAVLHLIVCSGHPLENDAVHRLQEGPSYV